MTTIPLAKSFAPKKLVYPVMLSEKYDGVPVAVTLRVDSAGIPAEYTIRTRQNEPCKSCETVVDEWMTTNMSFFEGFPGKHTMVGESFKDTSGIARRQEDQGTMLSWGIFDYFWDGGDMSYYDRFTYFCDKMQTTEHAFCIPFYTVRDEAELNALFEVFTRNNPKAEGMVARSADDIFNPGKRSWGYQKLLYEPTIDLFVVGVTEAVDKQKKPKNMVGGLVVSYKGTLSKVGAGKMTHKERTALFADVYRNEASRVNTGLPGSPNEVWYGFPEPRMAEIKHKADDSYDALRQPTFQHWRYDKDKPDA